MCAMVAPALFTSEARVSVPLTGRLERSSHCLAGGSGDLLTRPGRVPLSFSRALIHSEPREVSECLFVTPHAGLQQYPSLQQATRGRRLRTLLDCHDILRQPAAPM